jgi:peptidoglycan/xylan/chitin deacetylase (PgdA/CDA1 family)
MSREVSVVMFHYVRDPKRSKFPLIKSRTISDFYFQLRKLKRAMNFITPEQLIDSVVHKQELPPNAVTLSFDDGYLDHYQNVAPILNDMNLKGFFFPPVQPIEERMVMDVNKIHFILASEPNISNLICEINEWIDSNRGAYNLPEIADLMRKFYSPSTYDCAQITYIKLTLQRGLPKIARNILVSNLFRKYVSRDEQEFSSELYMSRKHIKEMISDGHLFGGHGYTHEWLDLLTPEQLQFELTKSRDFICGLGAAKSNWVMCYPYGSYPFTSASKLMSELLQSEGCSLAFTDHGGVTDLDSMDKYFLSRIDTNELPI